MTRRGIFKRGIIAVAVAGSLMGGALSGCAFGTPETERTEQAIVDYGEVADAVTAAVPRIVQVRDLTQSMNGFGYRLSLGLETETPDPFTAAELDAVVEAIWEALPWEPNTIKITAGADTDGGREVVDLRAAAAELDHLGVTNAGNGGVSLTEMTARYGAWVVPE